MTKPKRCWVVTDGRAGIENQALGLAHAVAEKTPLEVSRKVIAVKEPWRSLPRIAWGDPFTKLSPGGALLRPPFPDLWIGCGRLSVPLSIAVKKLAPDTLTVQLQNPRAPLSAFDLVIPPIHDGLVGDNVFSIVGAANRITYDVLASEGVDVAPLIGDLKSPRVAVLIGGTNADNIVTPKQASAFFVALNKVLDSGASLMVTYSRRTPPAVRALIDPLAASNPNVFLWDGETAYGAANPYLGILALADHIIVTGDSVNMVTEAGATGKPVHVYFWEGALNALTKKFRNFHETLIERGVTRVFQEELESWTYQPLTETSRAADAVVSLMAERAAQQGADHESNLR